MNLDKSAVSTHTEKRNETKQGNQIKNVVTCFHTHAEGKMERDIEKARERETNGARVCSSCLEYYVHVFISFHFVSFHFHVTEENVFDSLELN